MPEDSTFFIVEGLLSETGEFRIYRGYEDRECHPAMRAGNNSWGITLSILDAEGHSLAHSYPSFCFNLGCESGSTGSVAGVLMGAIARHENARQLVLKSNGRELYRADVGVHRPIVDDVDVSLDQNGARVRCRVEPGHADVQIRARVSDGRILRPRAEHLGNEFIVDLTSLEGLGGAALIVEATANFRTTRVASDSIPLPPATVQGRIIEPAPNSVWPGGWRGSLIGSLFDRNGRLLDWNQYPVTWIIDGERWPERRQLVAWQFNAGEHHLQLVRELQDGQFGVLDEVSIVVLPPTPEQERWETSVSRLPSQMTTTPSISESGNSTPTTQG